MVDCGTPSRSGRDIPVVLKCGRKRCERGVSMSRSIGYGIWKRVIEMKLRQVKVEGQLQDVGPRDMTCAHLGKAVVLG